MARLLTKEPMQDAEKKQKAFKTLSLVFAVAGVIWIIAGFISHRYLFYPFIGLLNWAIAYYCSMMSKTG
jgi:tetrahydromethanopterin S-methyltransferase subunit C